MNKKYTIAKIEKEKIWSDLNLSGSKFKEWCLTPEIFVKNETKVFPDIVCQKMFIGSKIEKFIFDLVKEKKEVEIDKRTFQRIDYNFCFANIDGKNNINDEEWIPLEIKNTEMELEQCFENYKYQLLYYCWFFEKKKILFITFTKGWKLRFKEIFFSEEDLAFCEKKVLEFKKYLLDKTIPNPEEFLVNSEKIDDKKIQETMDKIILLYSSVNENYKQLEEAKDYLKKFGKFENINYKNYNFKISEVTSNLFKKDLALKILKELNIDENDFFSKATMKKLSIKNIGE